MPNKCGVVNCTGNYNEVNKCRVFRIPKDLIAAQQWMNVLPPRENFTLDPTKFFICERHWPSDVPMVPLSGGSSRPAVPPSIFNVPPSCLPSPKPTPRPLKQEDQQLKYFLKKDKITSLADFVPDKELHKKYNNVIVSRTEEKCVFIFMSKNYESCDLSIIVDNKPTLCSPLVLEAYKGGVRVPLGKILNPNNGLTTYSQFFECVHRVFNYDIPLEDILMKIVDKLEHAQTTEVHDKKIEMKLQFLTRQLTLLAHKHFIMSDYCFAMESYPQCSYEQLRDVLVLPSKRKLQYIVSSVNVEEVLTKTFNKLKIPQQRNVLLLVDEVKIRPTIAYSGGVLNGMAKNDPDSKATAMLCVMMKCLHRGPSIMISATPVFKLTASYQFDIVKEAAVLVEGSGGIVLGSITDNHKVNQLYCKLFDKSSDQCCASVKHPLDSARIWYLLFDTVHLLKCIRNNWITEKCKQLTIDKTVVGSFTDVIKLYNSEKDNILKTTPLTMSAVHPSRLQLQNVQHVLRVFNDKVVAALKLQGCHDTANFIDGILSWWKTVNVSRKGQDIRLRDPHRAVQDSSSDTLDSYVNLFGDANSGHGPSREKSLTHDTKKALVQTMQGLVSICHHLTTNAGFEYVLLREIQSDRIEGEFSVYRQSTGANAFMSSGDVLSASKKRLAKHAASFLETIDVGDPLSSSNHVCCGSIVFEDALSIEKGISKIMLSTHEESCCAYVAGWLERKCINDVIFSDDEPLVSSEVKDFLEEVSRGGLITPHMCTYELVRMGLCFMKHARHRACCRPRLGLILSTMGQFYNIDIVSSKKLLRHLSNVLLNGLHNLEKDQQKNAVLLQTSIKKARLSD